MYLVLDLGHLYHLERSVSSRKAADHPATFTKIKVPPQMFLCFIIRQMVPNCDFLHFQKTLSLDFLEMIFPKLFWSLFRKISCQGKNLFVELWIKKPLTN